MRFHVSAGIVTLLSVLHLAGANQQDAVMQEMKRLEGKWQVTSLKFFGEESKDKRDKEAQYVFKGNQLRIINKSTEEDSTQTYRLDPTRNPKHFDLESPRGTVQGIYALDGDTLTLCLPFPFVTKERPTKLEAGFDGKAALMVLKRIKP
jgi:uncharacterized protein (TIGR03067 family)